MTTRNSVANTVPQAASTVTLEEIKVDAKHRCADDQDERNNAAIPLDPQGDNSKLTDIKLSTGPVDGTVEGWSISWNPNEFVMWPTKVIGYAGINDLGSFGGQTPDGAIYDPAHGIETFFGIGAPPTDVYGQSLIGSSDWDTTTVGFSITVEKAATPKVAAQDREARSNAYGTANGAEIVWNNQVVTGVLAGDMLIGQGTSVSVIWAGPMLVNTGPSYYSFNIPGAVAGYSNSGSIGSVTQFGAMPFASLTNSTHFYWASQSQNGKGVGKSVTCSGSVEGNSFLVSTYFDVFTPSWSFVEQGTVGTANDNGFGTFQFLQNANQFGIVYTGTVTDSGVPASLAGGQWSITQLVTPNVTLRQPGVGRYAVFQSGVEGLDGHNHPSFDSNDPLFALGANPVFAPVGPGSHEYADAPSVRMPALLTFLGLPQVSGASLALHQKFRTFLMFSPPGTDSIDVPLCVANWEWSFVAESKALNGPQGLGQVIWSKNVAPRPPSSSADPFGKPTSIFPQWTYIVSPSDYRKV